MANNKWRNVAYKFMQGENEDADVEANKERSISDGQRNDKKKDENTGVEVVSMKPLSSNPSNTSGVKGSGANNNGNSNNQKNEDNQLDSKNDNIGNSNDNENNQTQSLLSEINPERDTIARDAVLARKKYHDTEIHQFASKGDVDKCLQLLSAPNIDIDVKGKKGMTALHYAAQNGHEKLLKELLGLGADKYMKDLDDNLPMHYAARQGYLDCVKDLIEVCWRDDKQLNDKTNKGRTALMEAADSGSQDCCKKLVGLNVDDVDNQGNTALHLAVKGGYKMIVKFLLDSGANPTNQNDSGITPLHEAASQRTRNCLELLYDIAQPNVFQVDKKCKHIIHFAVTQMSADCLKYLLEKELIRVNIDKWDDSPKGTPLQYAMNCRTFNCVYSLLDAGASPTVGCNGMYPIHKAAELGFDMVCEKILAMNNSILNQRNDQNQTPLHMAAKSGHIETVDLIFGKIRLAQISPSNEDNLRQTALHIAVKKGNEKVVMRLIKGNIASGKQDSRGYTALHLAANMGKVRCCELLVKSAPSNLHKCCKRGFFPLDLAFKNMKKNEETVIYLLRESSLECQDKIPKHRNTNYLVSVMLLKRRMRRYMEKALDKKLSNIVDAILDSTFWEDSLFGANELKPENFKKLIIAYPNLAFKAQGKCITKSAEKTVYAFTYFENTYHMKDGQTAFDEETGKLKKGFLEHHKDVYSWAKNHSVTEMISHNESELLKHPVTQAWLRHKWLSYIRYIHYSLLVLEGIYLLTLICLMATSWNWIHISRVFNITKDEFCETAKHLYESVEVSAESTLLNATKTDVIREFEKKVDPYRVFYYWVTLTWSIKFLLEIFYMARLRHLYLAYETLPHVVIEISQLILTMMLIFYPLGMCYQERIGLLQEDLVWQCGIFAVLFAWLHLINSINQALTSVFLPITQDFVEILMKVAYFLITFIAIFAFIFHLLLLEQNAFASVWQSTGSTLVWLLLDLGYTDTFVEEKLSYPVLSNIIFFLFITTIGCLIVSLISKERTVKSKGKELDPEYRRLVVYTRLIFRYDICFPQFRQWFAVNKYVDSRKQQTILEYYLGEIENAESEEVTQDYREIVEQGKKLESMISDLSDQVTSIKLQLTKITHKESGLGDDHQ